MDNESDLFLRCLKCQHQKVDHDRNAAADKMKCLIGECTCKKYVPDRKYYRASRK
jgi:hypothetical protein